jgi:hypothetical protein
MAALRGAYSPTNGGAIQLFPNPGEVASINPKAFWEAWSRMGVSPKTSTSWPVGADVALLRGLLNYREICY